MPKVHGLNDLCEQSCFHRSRREDELNVEEEQAIDLKAFVDVGASSILVLARDHEFPIFELAANFAVSRCHATD
jgi:hypothetical protein